MEYLRIDESGTTSVVKDQDPENDESLMAEVADNLCEVIRYRGNQFERMLVTESEEDDPTFEVEWEAVEEAE